MAFEDLSLVLKWRNDVRTRSFMFNPNVIDYDTHRRWFVKNHKEPLRYLMLVCSYEKPFGFVQFSADKDKNVWEWGFYIDPDCKRGCGSIMGRTALDYASRYLGIRQVQGRVLSNNPKSLSFHQKLGFTQDYILEAGHLSENGPLDVHCLSIQLPHLLNTI